MKANETNLKPESSAGLTPTHGSVWSWSKILKFALDKFMSGCECNIHRCASESAFKHNARCLLDATRSPSSIFLVHTFPMILQLVCEKVWAIITRRKTQNGPDQRPPT